MSAFQSTAFRFTARARAVAGVFFVLMALASCASTPTAKDLTGMWASKSVQAGAAGQTFCFGSSGSVEWTSKARGSSRTYRGTYKLEGDVLTIESPDLEKAATFKASLSFGTLSLTAPTGSPQQYAKVPGTCDESGK